MPRNDGIRLRRLACGVRRKAMTSLVEIEAGKADANLGGGVYKQRVARRGQGKRGSFRTIVLLKMGDKAFFVEGFAKSKKANISEKDEQDFKRQAKLYFTLPEAKLIAELAIGRMMRIL